ncbi:putative ABC transporter ATP-binding protein YfiL [Paraliobacillus quinghaiensis]|uniref:ABC transporter ATP-binding protein YfiL n=1 Tax=Paraliobacillus quinghaiensis TaxID=470815 RepID=A0A917TIS5_9BACI|nr:ABC transporter ATP-binding protein [Paraliobacillus quinghaiensis]GGM23869.1 putative ABC transporter ATP-binding protein YfiL [Paraliobacillus quinghaiensis]
MLEVKHLMKSYGKRQIVKDVSFTINKGESFGLLGPNGAGKSTLISTICGLISYDQGEVYVNNQSIKKFPLVIKQKIGIVPQEIALYPTMSAKDNLMFWGKMYGLKGAKASKRVNEVLEFVDLKDRAKDRIETFSGGMKRRINIGAALMHEPEILIMDEPTVGIDPQSRNHILETVKKLNESGKTIIYTSHYMEEVEYLCDRIGIIDNGEVIALGTQKELCNRLAGGSVVHLDVENKTEQGIDSINEIKNVKHIVSKQNETKLEIYVNEAHETMGEIVTTAVNHGIKVLAVEVQEPNLESLFLQLTGRTLRD